MSLIDDLNKISEMQGKPPIDPTRIYGDGETYVPPASDPDVPAEWLDPELDTVPQSSPLRPENLPKPQGSPPAAYPPQMAYPAPAVAKLAVLDRDAAWKGRSVTLTEPEEAQVRAVVLRAIQREVESDLLEVVPKRRRRPAAKPVAVSEPASSPPKRKPGRPRKNP